MPCLQGILKATDFHFPYKRIDMRFTLWSPRNKNAIVRIYISGFDDAYIWRKNRTSPLEIKGAGERTKQTIEAFLKSYGIDLKSLKTRRELAYVLFEEGLLGGNFMHLYPTFCDARPESHSIFCSELEYESVSKTKESSHFNSGNVVSMADFKKRKK